MIVAVSAPTIVFAFVIATLFGAGFHLVVGGDVRRLALFLLAGWLGFALGHIFGTLFEITLMSIGTLRMLSASVGSMVALTVAYFLTTDRRNYSKRP
jgi:hypothetical protein